MPLKPNQQSCTYKLNAAIFKKTDKEILKPVGITSDDERWDKYSERLQKIRKIADYPYVMQVLEKNMSYEEVTEIFVRVNSLGIKLRGSDLALAQITSRWKGFMKLVEDFCAEFKDDGDYVLEKGLAVRTLVIFATHQSKFKTVGRLSKQKLEEAWKTAQNSLRFSINFIRSNAQIYSLSLLSSPYLLIPIAVYASLYTDPVIDRGLAKRVECGWRKGDRQPCYAVSLTRRPSRQLSLRV